VWDVKFMGNILSFDVSSVSTGWAFIFGGRLKEFGTIVPPKSFRLQEKLYWFKNEVNLLLKIFEPDYIIVEETYLKNVLTLKTLMQFISVVNVQCFEILGEEPIFISPQTVRSYYKLKNKEEVFEYIKNKYKVKLKNYTFETGNDITDSTLQGLYWYSVLSEKGEKNGE
jgi:Holliday junction resolvasome RuvABC endonuclease subunit